MTAIDLSIALTDNVRTRPIVEGRVRAQGIRFLPSVMTASEMFLRQLKHAEFDVSEMSMSSLLIAVARGDTRWAGLPVYTARSFFHTWGWVRRDRGIESPADLRGKRIGVPEYQQTAAIWARGVLWHEFGVAPHEIHWFMERTPDTSHGGATGFLPPPGVRVDRIPARTNIGEMLVGGELDGTLLYLNQPNPVDRSRIDLSACAEMRPLFADAVAEGRRFFAKTGLYPINHAMVVRRSLLDRYPWIAANIVQAFQAAKADAAATALGVLDGLVRTGGAPASLPEALRDDPMPYGFQASAPVLERIADWVFEQGLSPYRVSLDDVFALSTMSS